MSAPPHQSQGEENHRSAAPTTLPSTLEKHINALSTMANNSRQKDKDKGKRNVRDSSLSSLFWQVKNTKTRTTIEYGTNQVTVHESHRYVNAEDRPVGDPNKPKELILSCKYSCGKLFALNVDKNNH